MSTDPVARAEAVKWRAEQDRRAARAAGLHECSYCARYSAHVFTGEPTGHPRYVGTRAEVVAHADRHPIGDPEDMAVPVGSCWPYADAPD